MSWDSYLTNLTTLQDGTVVGEAAAIHGYDGSVWASSPGLSITAEEVKKILGDRSGFMMSGPTVGGMKCFMIRDQLDTDQEWLMPLKTKASEGKKVQPITVGKSKTALIFLVGLPDAAAGMINENTHKIVKYLRDMNM
ncbi:uncharacterized protein V6R79_013767 [Siganus canaliculatus]